MRREICAYKQLRMYNDCNECSGKNMDRMCYITSQELKLHLQQFREVMFLDRVNKGELEEQFDFSNFGMGFRV
jgi:hypothetical protein